MLLSEYYKDSKYSENGVNYKILEIGKNQRSIFKLECLKCCDTIFITPASVLSGRVSCSCSPRTISREKMFSKFIESCKKKNIKITTDIKEISAKDPILAECGECSYTWNTTYNSVVLKDSSCPMCNGAVKLQKDAAERRLIHCLDMVEMNLEKFWYKSTGDTSECRVEVVCRKCGNQNNTSVASVFSGRGCPKCAKFGFKVDAPGVLYLLSVKDTQDNLLGYKYGITCNLPQRLQQHRKLSNRVGLYFEIVKVWSYLIGLDCSEHEKVIKRRFIPHISKDSMPAGYTETISCSDLHEFLNIQEQQYRSLYG